MKITNIKDAERVLTHAKATPRLGYSLGKILENFELSATENGHMGEDTLEWSNRDGDSITLDLVKPAVYDLDEDGEILSVLEEEIYRIRLIFSGGKIVFSKPSLGVSEISEVTGKSRAWIYKMAEKLGRLPTIQEVENTPPSGRPTKY